MELRLLLSIFVATNSSVHLDRSCLARNIAQPCNRKEQIRI
jgi:hypothetical protein